MIIALFIGLIGLLIGTFLLFLSTKGKRNYLEIKKRCTLKAKGTLIRFREHKTTREHMNNTYNITYYYPIYEYLIDDKKYEVESNFGESNKNISLIGDKKDIFYNPNNCEESYIDEENLDSSFNKVKILGIIFLVAGIVDILIFIILKEIM